MKGHSLVRLSRFAILTTMTMLSVGSRASADMTVDLNLTGNYNSTPITFSYTDANNPPTYTDTVTENGGGQIPATLNGVSLPYLYCLQFSVNVGDPGDYTHSILSTTGQIHSDSLLDPSGSLLDPFDKALADSTALAKNIAWLIVNKAQYANDAISQAGLQAAIWEQVTPGFSLLNPTNTTDPGYAVAHAVYTDYMADKSALTSAITAGLPDDVGKVLFLTPEVNSGDNNQALVGYIATPEPSTFVMALSALIPLGVVALRRRRRGPVTTP